MPVSVQSIVNEAIRFERSLSSLYLLFSEAFPDDADLWWELSVSEEGHASLLECSQTLFREEFIRDTAEADLNTLRRSNEELESVIRRLEKQPLERREAFQIALRFESDENEGTIYRFLKIEPSQQARDVVDSIERQDLAHSRKIHDYAASKDFAIDPPSR